MESIIPSVLNLDKIVYCISNNHDYNSPSHMYLGYNIKQYETYGDGTTQHSRAYYASTGQAYDFLLSFAAFLADDTKATPEAMEAIRYNLGWHMQRMNETAAKFLASLIYDAEKRGRYYSMELEKVSSSESKRHDKRWELIPDYADGSTEAIARLWFSQHHGMPSNLLEYMGIYFTACKVKGGYAYELTENKTIAAAFGDLAGEAFNLFGSVLGLINLRNDLESHKDNARRRVKRAADNAAEKAAELQAKPEPEALTA